MLFSLFLFCHKLQAQEIRNIQPSGGTLVIGDLFTVTWESPGVSPSDNVKISLKRDSAVEDEPIGENYWVLIESTRNDKSEPFRVPDTIAPADDWYVWIKDLDDPLVDPEHSENAITIKAKESVRYRLTLVSDPAQGGNISASPQPDSNGTYEANTRVTLTANPAEGYSFTRWEGNGSGTDREILVNMTQDKTVRAVFTAKARYALTVNISPPNGGTVTRSLQPGANGKYEEGTQVTLTANPAEGFRLLTWSGDAGNQTAEVTITMNRDKSVTANFDLTPTPVPTSAPTSIPQEPTAMPTPNQNPTPVVTPPPSTSTPTVTPTPTSFPSDATPPPNSGEDCLNLKWVKVAEDGPSPRTGHAMVYDPIGKRVILVGGETTDDGWNTRTYLRDTWAWDGHQWEELQVGGLDYLYQTPFMYFDETNNQIMLIGYYDEPGQPKGYYSWILNDNRWVRMSNMNVGVPDNIVYNSKLKTLFLLNEETRGDRYVIRFYSWNGSEWISSSSTDEIEIPIMNYVYKIIFDENRDVYVFSTRLTNNPLESNTYRVLEWDGNDWKITVLNNDFYPTGDGLVYHPIRNTIVTYGADYHKYTAYTWEWDGETWNQILAIGPPLRIQHTMVYDSARQKIVLFGGYDADQNPTILYGDTWELSCTNEPPSPEILTPEYFPDPAFRESVREALISEGIHIFTAEGLSRLKVLNCVNRGITDAKGIECLTGLQELRIDKNQISVIDVSKSPNIVKLSCYENNLSHLDVSNLQKLQTLQCARNQLLNLYLTNHPELWLLECNENNLTALNVSGCPLLGYLDCRINQIRGLDLSNNNVLYILWCSFNQISDIDGILASRGLRDPIRTGVDLRFNNLDCGDWEDAILLKSRFSQVEIDNINRVVQGVAISPQNRFDPYDCINNPVPTIPTEPTEIPLETPTPTTTPVPFPTTPPDNGTDIQPDMVYEFDQATLNASGWSEILGGFNAATPGFVSIDGFVSGLFPESADRQGLEISVRPLELVFLHATDPIQTNGKTVLLRAYVRSDSADAAVALAALKGNLITGENLDSSIATHIPATSASMVEQPRVLILVYEPDGGDLVTPIIQVNAASESRNTIISVDKIEVFLLDKSKRYPGSLFSAGQ